MNDTLAVVLAGGKGSRLEPHTRDRAKSAVAFGGIYRINSANRPGRPCPPGAYGAFGSPTQWPDGWRVQVALVTPHGESGNREQAPPLGVREQFWHALHK